VLDTHLKSLITRRRLRSGPAADHVDGFADWLHRQGYRPSIMRKMLQSLAAWTDWLRATGRAEIDLNEGIEACAAELQTRSRVRYQRGPNADSLRAARVLVRYLREQGALSQLAAPLSPSAHWPLLGEFLSWMSQNRGVTKLTLAAYERILVEFFNTLGDAPHTYTAEALRGFVLKRAKCYGVSYAKLGATAVRALLRFLAATGKCRGGLEYSIPVFASWKFSSIPRYIAAEDLQRVMTSCTDNPAGLRNRAILLLLARLGLRAGDIVGIRLSDLDWKNGRLAVCGKGRRREFLPLPQEVGDAILDYLQQARPPLPAPELFITTRAPFGPLSTQAVSGIVRTSLLRAGVKAPAYGAHVLRHTAATSMLRQGASLAGIGAVLRHRSPQTTAHYAKVDIVALSEIAQPWPGATSC
jgi:integrase/recombinase XerD